jgi:ADP-ribosylglycohydrolase
VIGAIVGDVIGSVHEYAGTRTTEFDLFDPDCCFTDDTVLTVAVAECLLGERSYADAFHDYFRRYPTAGYGRRFTTWATRCSREPYHSWGNGSAMRVSPVAYARDSFEKVLVEARRSAAITHDHLEGIRGAQATAAAVYLARQGEPKAKIKATLERRFGYDLSRRLDDIRPGYSFNESCQRTVPEALIAFLESESFEDAIRKAISLGGDADTLACIAGGIAAAHYGGVPREIAEWALGRLDAPLKEVTVRFCERYGV